MSIIDYLTDQRDAGNTPSDEWLDGWRDGREALAGELDAAYRRGKRDAGVRHVVRIDHLATLVAFIAGFVIADAIAAGQS